MLTSLTGTLLVLLSGLAPGAPRSVASTTASCRQPLVRTADGCRTPAAVGQELTRIVNSVRAENNAQAVVARVDVRGRTLLRRGFGEAQAGVRAGPNQNFRLGSMLIPGITSAIYRLRDRGRLKIRDPISKWLPTVPRSGRVTIGMLMNGTSGYRDWIQGNQDFVNTLNRNPFRTWTESELLKTALDQGFACEPGACFHYAHTNYLLLGRVIRKVTGSGVAQVLRRRILDPLGMTGVRLSAYPAMRNPVLHSFTTERGMFEDATGWSPSWTIGRGEIGYGTIDDVALGARGILSGRTLKPVSRRQLVSRPPPVPPGFPPNLYFAQGLLVSNGWRLQNPYLNGYMGNMGWLPQRRIAVALVATRGPKTAPADDTNFTDGIFKRIAGYLTPHHIPAYSD